MIIGIIIEESKPLLQQRVLTLENEMKEIKKHMKNVLWGESE